MIDIYAKNQWQYNLLDIGYQIENLARRVLFDITALRKEFGDGKTVFVLRRPTEETYYIANNQEKTDKYAIWNITNIDNAIDGEGEAQLRYIVNDVIVATIIWKTKINKSLAETGDVPDPIEEYINKMIVLADDAKKSAQDSEASADEAERQAHDSKNSANTAKRYADESQDSADASLASKLLAEESAREAAISEANAEHYAELLENPNAVANTLPEGSDATASYNNGTFTFGIPKGDTGEAATVEVGNVYTLQPNQSANVVNTGDENDAVFDFYIPKGETGASVTKIDDLLLDASTPSTDSFPVPADDETGSVLFGKIIKFFNDVISKFTDITNTIKDYVYAPTFQTVTVSFSNEYYKIVTYTPTSINGYKCVGVAGWYIIGTGYYPVSITKSQVYLVHYNNTPVTANVDVRLWLLYVRDI